MSNKKGMSGLALIGWFVMALAMIYAIYVYWDLLRGVLGYE